MNSATGASPDIELHFLKKKKRKQIIRNNLKENIRIKKKKKK
jgi:hypothetical protein